MTNQKIAVHDRMQQGYEYELSEPAGENFPSSFQPELSPKKLLAMGVFGGKYLTDCRDEFPSSWFDSAKLNPEKSLAELNFFGVHASKPLSYWREKGWIAEQDPRGWFQWYCRYFMGRRSDDDLRQIGRWRAMRRHIGQLQANCVRGDLLCRPRQRQALLHWAYDSRNY
jgi:hypothetical protein